MRILLVLPRDNTYYHRGAFSRTISYAPLTLTKLAALVPPELEAEIELVDEGVELPKYRGFYDVVGLTAVASSSPRAYELAAFFRRRGSFVVLGGAHPSLNPEEAACHGDAVVVGLGERSWPQLLRDWRAGGPQRVYRTPRFDQLETVIPRRDLLRRGAYVGVPTVLATMGCRNRCSFCSVHALWGQAYRRKVEEVVAEIEALGSRNLLFLDPNLTADPDYAKELFRQLIPLRKQWAGLVSMDAITDRELLDLLERSGCRGLLTGFESISQASLDLAAKHVNRLGKYKEIVGALHSRSIVVLGTFVLGLDGDTTDSLRRTVEAIDEIGIDVPRFSVLTPFPGTTLYDRCEEQGRILTKNWFYYDQEHVVFRPQHMSARTLQEQLHLLWAKSYSMPRIFQRLARYGGGGRLALLLGAVNLGMRQYGSRLSSLTTSYLDTVLAEPPTGRGRGSWGRRLRELTRHGTAGVRAARATSPSDSQPRSPAC